MQSPVRISLLGEKLGALIPNLLDGGTLEDLLVPLSRSRELLLKVEVLEETVDGDLVPAATTRVSIPYGK